MSNEVVEKVMQDGGDKEKLRRFSTIQLLNFCLGFFGLQFAWQMRIILSGPVTEGFGASPFLFGLIWLAGPFTGMVVQPIVGALSDKTNTVFGRRRPYLLGGAILASLALWAFPNSSQIAGDICHTLGFNPPIWGALAFAALMIWIIDACINIAQGPYRALIPDTMPSEQYSIANSFLSFAIGLGSVVAAGTAPFLKYVCNYQMSINSQFIMAALAFSLAMIWTCMTISERNTSLLNKTQDQENNVKDIEKNKESKSMKDSIKEFFALSPEVAKICTVQFFTWIGVMCMFIFFTQYIVHSIYAVPDLTTANESIKALYAEATLKGTNLSSIGFAVLNLICFIVSIPIGVISSKLGSKNTHTVSLMIMAIAYLGLAFTKDVKTVILFMGLAGIGWASILALPFAMLSQYIKQGTEGTMMGIFNIFIAGPQVFVCTLIAWIISKLQFTMPNGAGINYHWEYSLIIGAVVLFISAGITQFIKEKKS